MYLTHTTDEQGNHRYFINGRRVTEQVWKDAYEPIKDTAKVVTTRRKGLWTTVYITLDTPNQES